MDHLLAGRATPAMFQPGMCPWCQRCASRRYPISSKSPQSARKATFPRSGPGRHSRQVPTRGQTRRWNHHDLVGRPRRSRCCPTGARIAVRGAASGVSRRRMQKRSRRAGQSPRVHWRQGRPSPPRTVSRSNLVCVRLLWLLDVASSAGERCGSRRRTDRWCRPFRGDDGVEFRSEQVLVAAYQVEELLIGAAPIIEAIGLQDIGHRCHRPRLQALIACRSSPSRAIEILRGLARSATGIVRVSTPAS